MDGVQDWAHSVVHEDMQEQVLYHKCCDDQFVQTVRRQHVLRCTNLPRLQFVKCSSMLRLCHKASVKQWATDDLWGGYAGSGCSAAWGATGPPSFKHFRRFLESLQVRNCILMCLFMPNDAWSSWASGQDDPPKLRRLAGEVRCNAPPVLRHLGTFRIWTLTVSNDFDSLKGFSLDRTRTHALNPDNFSDVCDQTGVTLNRYMIEVPT